MFEINVYDDNDKIIKTVKAKEFDLRMGTVRKISEIVPFGDLDGTKDIIEKLYIAQKELTAILNILFPDMSDSDWDGVKINELLAVIVNIGKYTVQKALTIPADSSKN